MRKVPNHIMRPDYVRKGKSYREPRCNGIINPSDIDGIRDACKLAHNLLDYLEGKIEIGISTDKLDEYAHEYIISHNAYPSPLMYKGFPKSICTSINDVICHGIPDNTILKDGDIINIDVTVYLNGYHGDTSKTFPVGNVSDKVIKLLKDTEASLMVGIDSVKVGRDINIIGESISNYLNPKRYGIVEDFAGHGIGKYFHTHPLILHYKNSTNLGKIYNNMVFTIEPMVNLGSKDYDMLDDGWTVKSVDKSYSAQFEHTIFVTTSGIEILT